MSSLSGAPSLTSKRQPASFTFDRPPPDEDEMFPVDDYAGASRGASKERKEKKPKKDKKDKKDKKSSGGHTSGSGTGGKSSSSAAGLQPPQQRGGNVRDADDYGAGEYSDDFVDEPISSVPLATTALDIERERAKLQAEADAMRRQQEDQLRQEREEHERRVREWNMQRLAQEQQQLPRSDTPNLKERRNSAHRRSSPDLRASSEQASPFHSQDKGLTPQQADHITNVIKQQMEFVIKAQQDQLAQFATLTPPSVMAAQHHHNADGVVTHVDPTQSDGGTYQAPLDPRLEKERDRRRRRERDRDRDARRMHEEEAAHSLFHRLAKDVREVFHELNMSVVAAEKERLLKDERYRKEREMRDRREEVDRMERTEKERKDREEREERMWKMLDEREEKFRGVLEMRLGREEQEREDRLRRDLEEKSDRVRNDRDLRDELERLDRERRDREDSSHRDRDRILLQSQLDEVKKQYRLQMEEMRRQFDLDRAHVAEIHKLEMGAMEKRHVEAASMTEKHHREQLILMDLHSANASKLEQLIKHSREEMEAAKKLNENITEERLQIVKERERQIDDQMAMVTKVYQESQNLKESLERERMRLSTLYAQFDISIASFNKENEEERRKHRESQLHYETLRQQVEKDRRMMIHEIQQERKLMENQHEEYLQQKMTSVSELQNERIAIQKERAEANLVRERQNRDESQLMLTLRSREEELRSKLESIDADRVSSSEMKREAARLREDCVAEREAIRRDRALFEAEKQEMLHRMEEIKLRAEEAGEEQHKLRKELAQERLAGNAGRSPPHPTGNMATMSVSQLQLDLAKQRAMLSRIAEHSR